MSSYEEPASGTWMTIADVFHIKGRGTVVTGLLQGTGLLHVGDILHGGDQSWPVGGIEQFRATVTSVGPGENIGVLLKNGPPGAGLRGRTAQFESKGAFASDESQFTVIEPKKRRWRH
jgi:translation elongation factor EF-Tu-like GTPase